jgi:hypothetical protein
MQFVAIEQRFIVALSHRVAVQTPLSVHNPYLEQEPVIRVCSCCRIQY